MYSLRVIKTTSKASAVQVVWYEYRKVNIAAHIGRAHPDEELETLKKDGAQWIAEHSNQDQLALFSPSGFTTSNPMFSLENYQLVGVGYSFIYSCLDQLFIRFGFGKLDAPMLFDLALIRIIQPASKLRSFELLKELFGISYAYRSLSRHLPGFTKYKDVVEGMVLEIAKSELGFDFTVVFYDVTTLYFESFGEDELRKPGFSKDGKSSKSQILIGLIVNKEGFPVAYQVFEGNTFEGHTISSQSLRDSKHVILFKA